MSFQMQQTIKRNAQQIRSYVHDLYDWQQEMQLKQKAKQKLYKQQRTKQQQIKKELQEKNKIKQEQEKKKKQEQRKKQEEEAKTKPDLIRDTNTIKDYYNAWDKFNIDDQIKRLEDQQTRPYRPYNPYENSQNYIRAKPKSKVNINIKGQRAAIIDPSQLKDKGNLHFKVCQYQKACQAYSQCLQKLQQTQNTSQVNKLKAVVLSNRAMTYMKLNERAKALRDCNESLKLDQGYVKSYLRRADCHKRLGNYRQSLKDYKKVKQLDPQDKDTANEIKKIQTYLQKLFKQARQSLIINTYSGRGQNTMMNIPDSYRIQIQEVQEYEKIQVNGIGKKQKQEKKVNYLEEL